MLSLQQQSISFGWLWLIAFVCVVLLGVIVWWRWRRVAQGDRQRLDFLSEMGQSVTGSLRLSDVLQQILDQIPQLIGAEGVAILLQEGEELVFVAVSGTAASGLQGYRMPIDAGVAGRVAQTRHSLTVTGPTGRSQIYRAAEQVSGYESQTLLAVPLAVGAELVGVLEAVHSQPNGFSIADLQTLEDAANWAAIAIQNARLYEQAMTELQERQRAELSLRESEHRYRTLAEVSPVGIFRLDAAGHYLYANGRFRDITKLTAVSGFWLDDLPLKDVETAQEMWETAVLQPLMPSQPVLQHEFELAEKDDVWVLVTVAPEFSEQGEHIGYIGTLADVSQQKQAEAILRYGAKMESLDLFAGAIAHDYNNLLMAMMGQAAIAQYQLDRESPANVHIDKLTQTAERAADLTKKVLTYSGGQYFERESASLNRLVLAQQAAFQAVVPESVDLEWDLAPELPLVQTDAQQVEQLLLGLLTNAVESLVGQPAGVITVQTAEVYVSSEDAHLWHYTNMPLEPGFYCMLAVEDNGMGIAKRDLPKIFDPFFSTKAFGKGLGLSTVLGLVRGHEGGIVVTSELGRGSRFEIYLPTQTTAVLPAV